MTAWKLLVLIAYSEALTLRKCTQGIASVKPVEALQAALRGGQYIANHVRADGSFDYMYYPDRDESSQHDYNWLRHAGATYALFQVYAREKDDFMLTRGRLALASLSQKIRPCPGGMCLDVKDSASIGGNGLAMMAFLAYQGATKDRTYEKMTHELASWILQQQRANGSFEERSLDIQTGKLQAHQNPYGQGEALLALIQLYQMDSQQKHLSAVIKGLHAIFERADDSTFGHMSHWVGPALRFAHDFMPEQQHFNYSRRLVRSLQSKLDTEEFWRPKLDPSHMYCLSPCASACLADGAAASWALMQNAQKPREASEALHVLEPVLKYILQVHIDTEQSALFYNPSAALGGLMHTGRQGAGIRIDDVQHATTALLAYVEESEHLRAC